MAQPDYQNLADALATAGANLTAVGAQITTAGTGVTIASQECARIPNGQAIRDNQTLIDLMNQNQNQIIQQITQQITQQINTLQISITNRIDAR
jgi:hypothetical protein